MGPREEGGSAPLCHGALSRPAFVPELKEDMEGNPPLLCGRSRVVGEGSVFCFVGTVLPFLWLGLGLHCLRPWGTSG